MAKETTQHAERISKKIVALRGRLLDVAQHRSTDENSWQPLSMALDEKKSLGRPSMRATPEISPMTPEKH